MLLSQAIQANNLSPVPVIERPNNKTTFQSNVPVTFDASNSYNPDNTNIINYYWWYVDGQLMAWGSNKKTFTTTFTLPPGSNTGSVQIKLKVRDNENTTNIRINTLIIYSESYYLANTNYYLTDHLGSILTTIDHFGNVTGYDDYYPFGLPMPGRSSNLRNPNDLNKFTGHERDNEGGLMIDYMLARNYEPEIGRFMSVDPLAYQFPHVSPFTYTENNPINRIDPDGKSWWGLATGAAIEYATQVVGNVADGDKLDELDTWIDVDLSDIGVAAAFGAASGGLSNIKQLGNVSKLGKYMIDALESATANVLEEGVKVTTGSEKEEYFSNKDIRNSAAAGAFGRLLGVVGENTAKNPMLTTDKGANLYWNARTPKASAKTKQKAAEYDTGKVANAAENAGTNVIQKGIEEIDNR